MIVICNLSMIVVGAKFTVQFIVQFTVQFTVQPHALKIVFWISKGMLPVINCYIQQMISYGSLIV